MNEWGLILASCSLCLPHVRDKASEALSAEHFLHRPTKTRHLFLDSTAYLTALPSPTTNLSHILFPWLDYIKFSSFDSPSNFLNHSIWPSPSLKVAICASKIFFGLSRTTSIYIQISCWIICTTLAHHFYYIRHCDRISAYIANWHYFGSSSPLHKAGGNY